MISKIPGAVYSQTLVALNLNSSPGVLSIESDVTLYGYPKDPDRDHLNYAAPEALDSDYDEIQDALCPGTPLICTTGKLKSIGEILRATCISANGMSGGPLIIRYLDQPLVIGFLHGGPSTPLHYNSMILRRSIESSINVTAAYALIDYIQADLSRIGDLNLKLLCKLLKRILNGTATLMDFRICKGHLCMAYLNAITYEKILGKDICYNNCINVLVYIRKIQKKLDKFN